MKLKLVGLLIALVTLILRLHFNICSESNFRESKEWMIGMSTSIMIKVSSSSSGHLSLIQTIKLMEDS